ncbi:hypothetical protein ACFVZ3_40485 [Kitasatospora purpeofusca]|uniref:hypothetical protein n=1 Tax=Kitasatospora purpeofusca TaxID=67352 RepID=UPI0036B958B1
MVHPLTLLRTGMGLSHPEYARLVAERHAGLGHGRTAARREKVSRWESGRIVPEYTAQLAMADIHGVPAGQVGRLGWPHWLYLAVGDAPLRDEHWNGGGAAAVLRSSAHLAEVAAPPGLVLRGPALAGHLRAAVARASAPGRGRVGGGVPAAVDGLEWISARVAGLEQQFHRTRLPPTALYVAAVAEHRLVVRLLTAAGHDRATGRHLLLLGARTALLCAWISGALGEQARAERQALAATRAAAVAGDRVRVSGAMLLLGLRHLEAGDPADVRMLVRAAGAAGAADPDRPAAFAAVLHGARAVARAREGEAGRADRSLARAEEAVAGCGDASVSDTGREAEPDHLTLNLVRARVAVHLGRCERAERHVDAVTRALAVPRSDGTPPFTALYLLTVLDVALALGDVDRAADVVEQVVVVTGGLPPVLGRQFRERLDRLDPLRREPRVRRAAERLAEYGAP